MWQVTPKSKTQLVICELPSKYLLVISALEVICAIGAFIICDSFWYILLSDILSIYFDLYALFLGNSVFQWTFFSKVSGFRNFAMNWSSDTHLKHVFGFQPLCSICLLLQINGLKGDLLFYSSFHFCLNHFHLGVILHSECILIERTLLFLHFLLNCPNQRNKLAR